MADKVVRVVFDADGFVQTMKRFRAAVDANPMRDDEMPADWMRRVIDAVYWKPDGWYPQRTVDWPEDADE